MSIRESYMSSFGEQAGGFDASSLVQRITLCDRVIIEGGHHIGELLDLLGSAGATTLVEEGILSFVENTGFVGREDHRMYGLSGRGKDLPRLSWFFEGMHIHRDPRERIASAAQAAAASRGIAARAASRLVDAVESSILPIDWNAIRPVRGLMADLAGGARPTRPRRDLRRSAVGD